MLSIEHGSAFKKRVKFNRPFENVDIHIGEASEVINTLAGPQQHILWLDYDEVIDGEKIEDIRSASGTLSPGSVLLLTVDNQPPGPRDAGPNDWRDYYIEEAEGFLPADPLPEYFAESNLTKVNLGILQRAIMSGVGPRADIEFTPLFNFLYADGHEMLSVGGMITTSAQKRLIARSALSAQNYFRDSLMKEPYRISVPNLTRRERLYLDSAMPSAPDWIPSEFELTSAEVAAYNEIYRFFPAYAELLL